jgi:hypothetical protein
MQSVTSNAVSKILKSVEFSGTTDSNGELEVTSFLPSNAIPLCVASTVAGNIKITPVNYCNLQGQFTGNYFWVQVFNDMNNTFRSYFYVTGIIFYIEKS